MVDGFLPASFGEGLLVRAVGFEEIVLQGGWDVMAKEEKTFNQMVDSSLFRS